MSINLQLIYRAVLEILRFKKKRLLNFNLKLWTNHFAFRTRPRAIQHLPLQRISKRLSQLYSRHRWTYKTHFYSFFNVYVFVNYKRTAIARTFFLENIGILILFQMLPIRFRYIYLFSRNYDLKDRLQKILTSNISEIYGPIILPKKLDRELCKIYL